MLNGLSGFPYVVVQEQHKTENCEAEAMWVLKEFTGSGDYIILGHTIRRRTGGYGVLQDNRLR